jgi:hypothetical protein
MSGFSLRNQSCPSTTSNDARSHTSRSILALYPLSVDNSTPRARWLPVYVLPLANWNRVRSPSMHSNRSRLARLTATMLRVAPLSTSTLMVRNVPSRSVIDMV